MIQHINWIFKVLLIFGTLLLCTNGFTQKSSNDKGSLESRQKKLKEQIAYNQKLLNEARKNKAISLGEINLLNTQIRKRKELVFSIETEIQYLNRHLASNERTIRQLETDIGRLKAGYAKSIFLSYKLRTSNDKLLYLLASETLNQAWNRIRFLQRMAITRKKMYQQLNESKDQVVATTTLIRNQVNEKQMLKDNKSKEKLNLTVEKDKKNQALTRIQKEEKKIVAEINRQQKEATQLEARIKQIIKEELSKSANRKAEATPKAKEVTVAEVKLSNTFAANKGKLPWPVEKGTVCSTFGTHKHPDFDIYTENNGIDFMTTSGTTARAVFEGEVSEVIQLPSYFAVLVKHGDYFTLYSKLESVFVKKGEKIPTGHLLGLIKTGDHGTEFHFEIWQGKSKQNPQLWLRK